MLTSPTALPLISYGPKGADRNQTAAPGMKRTRRTSSHMSAFGGGRTYADIANPSRLIRSDIFAPSGAPDLTVTMCRPLTLGRQCAI